MSGLSKAKNALDFDKVIDYIAIKCVSGTGKARLKNSDLLFQKNDLQIVLEQVQEMRDVFLSDGGFPIWDFIDIRVLLNKIEPEDSFLEIKDFLKVQNFLELVEESIVFRKKIASKYPLLLQLLQRLEESENLLSQIRFTFEPSGRVFDNASSELKAIRKETAKVDAEIHKHLDRILRSKSEHIQEEYLTLRDGRLVVPVREYSVSKVPGIVHGQSGSGATYFVEPMAVVDLNNQMQKLLAAEHKEIVKILKRISRLLRADGPGLISNLHILNELDVLQAKARYANEFDCRAPQINDRFFWELKAARHPQLLKMHPDSTVPLTCDAGKRFNELIISGPNAGGKTVALKTIGLLQLLFQSGNHIPVGEGTVMPLCEQIYSVIGDEQSIENDLSTFSSHINALNEIIANVKEGSLVLIDEIGSGTEPTGGASLSIAILERLNREGIVSVVTTHQNQLKSFAADTEGIENAAMQYDMEHLTPLFSLEMGIPGSSYTFDICRRLGLDEQVLERAAALSGQETFKLDALLSDVAHKSHKYQEMTNRISIKESELNSLTELYKVKNDVLRKKHKQFEKEAKAKASELLQNVNRDIEAAIREIRESQADRQVVKKVRDRLNGQKENYRPGSPEKKKETSLTIDQVKEGQRVRSLQYGIKGTVSKVFKGKDEIEIEKDGLKITVDLADTELLDDHGNVLKNARPQTPSGESGSGAVNVNNELDLRGLMTEEAIRAVESYLDQAVMSSWDEVRLVHGKGTGALRQAVHKYLSRLKTIKSYRIGKWGEGDSGVTVVLLK